MHLTCASSDWLTLAMVASKADGVLLCAVCLQHPVPRQPSVPRRLQRGASLCLPSFVSHAPVL